MLEYQTKHYFHGRWLILGLFTLELRLFGQHLLPLCHLLPNLCQFLIWRSILDR